MNPYKALWGKGDFTKLAATFRENGVAFVSNLGITKGMKVLDLGCGDGTTAIPEARLGADVLGVDIASNLVAAGIELQPVEIKKCHLVLRHFDKDKIIYGMEEMIAFIRSFKHYQRIQLVPFAGDGLPV